MDELFREVDKPTNKIRDARVKIKENRARNLICHRGQGKKKWNHPHGYKNKKEYWGCRPSNFEFYSYRSRLIRLNKFYIFLLG